MERRVLLSYLERNKPVTIPRDIVDGDISYLREKFLQSFDYSKNVKLRVTFQRYDNEWEMFTDLEEDARIEHKDKLKVVVSPSLTDTSRCSTADTSEVDPDGHTEGEVCAPTAVTGESASDSFDDMETKALPPACTDYSQPSTSTPIRAHSFHDSDDDNMPQPPRKRNKDKKDKWFLEDSSSESSLTVSEKSSSGAKEEYTLVVPSSVKKSKEDSGQPLPDPFPLPVHFRPDVEACLKQGRMTVTAKAAFFSAVAAAMFQFKRFPSRDEKVSVAKQIVAKYPFLGTTGLGTTYGGIVQTIEDRFKDLRRDRTKARSKKALSESQQLTCKKERKPDPYTVPDVPEGEDEVSFERHNRVLKSEWSKSSRNALMVEQLMDRTFPMRRRSILEEQTDVLTTFKHYPFLQDSTQLCRELERISGIDSSSTLEQWTKMWVPKVLKQAQFERGSRPSIATVHDEILSNDWNESLCAMALLTSLIPDSRHKADYTKVLWPSQGDLTASVKKGQKSPYILVLEDGEQAFLVVDKCLVCECTPIENIPILLLSAFFCFNIHYPQGCNNFYSFMEYTFLNKNTKLPASVKHFIATLNNI